MHCGDMSVADQSNSSFQLQHVAPGRSILSRKTVQAMDAELEECDQELHFETDQLTVLLQNDAQYSLKATQSLEVPNCLFALPRWIPYCDTVGVCVG